MKLLSALKIIALSMALTAVLLLGWIGLSVLAYNHSAGSISANAVLNFMLAALLAFIGLPILHRAFYRYFWVIKRKLASGEMQIGDRMPVIGSEPHAPPPRTAKTRGQIAHVSSSNCSGGSREIPAWAPSYMAIVEIQARTAAHAGSRHLR